MPAWPRPTDGGEPGEAPPTAQQIRTRKRLVTARTPMQSDYLASLQNNDLVFATGPAGTGKTYLAVAFAAACLEAGRCDRIILSRPAVEAGERLGFLPGDMREKVDPYLRPLYDALYDVLAPERVERELTAGVIEIAPLAFMRGRTLSHAIVILDEAQNCTAVQLKMFLTRLGENSKMIVTGDPTQVDLPPGKDSGLTEAIEILRGIDEIGHIAFTKADVVRRELVGRIVEAYEAVAQDGGRNMTEDGPSRSIAEPTQPAALAVEIVHHGGAWADAAVSDAMVELAAHAAFAEAIPRTPASYELTIVLTDDAEMRSLNRQWRGKDAPTNVLSFPAGDAPGEPGPLGDVVIAYETAVKEAEDGNLAFADHVSHLVVHGVLHLLGLDHMQDDEAERMEDLERRGLASLGIADPYRDEGEAGLAEASP